MMAFFLQYPSPVYSAFTIRVLCDIIRHTKGGDPMAKLSFHIAHIISSFYHTLLKLHAIPDFCLSRKKNKKTGKVYLYKQESTRNGRKQTKIIAADESETQAGGICRRRHSGKEESSHHEGAFHDGFSRS